MTLKYNDYLTHIKITPPMKNRILQNVTEKMEEKQKHTWIHPKTLISIAATFAIVLFSSLLLPSFFLSSKTPSPNNTLSVIPKITKYENEQALSEAVGFNMKAVMQIPFTIESIHYTSYWNELAEIVYTGIENQLTFRMTPKSDDPSGDYTVYSMQEETFVQNTKVTLRGNHDLFYSALWKKEGFSYSIKVENGIAKQDLLTIISSVT